MSFFPIEQLLRPLRIALALKGGVFAEEGIFRIDNAAVGGFLVMSFSGDGGRQINRFFAVPIDDHDILVGMRFFLAGVMSRLLVVGAEYSLETGAVEFFDGVPEAG